ncbi:MAG: TolC family protein, partial [Bacteroidales bacterium]|nr:TolC family protein [Bacteroidales bacterium]
LPQTSVSMMYNNYMGTELKLLEGMDPIKMVPTATATFQATQVIFNANVLVGIQLAELSKQMSENNFLQTELSIKQSVSTAYYSILVSEDNKRILEKNVENIRTLVKATHAKVGVGIGEQTEADQMDVTLANLENTLQSVNQNIELAYNSMHLILGIGVNDELKLTDPLNILTERCNSYELLAQPFELENNHDMKASELGLEMSKKQYDSSIASMLPSLAAVYQHNEKVMSGGFDMTMKNTLVLSASVPLVVGGKNVSGVKKARLAYESSRLDNDLAKDQLLLQEKQLRYNLKTAQTSYELQKKNIEVSQRVFDNITKKYEQGLSSSLELTTANNNLLTAQSNYINAVMSLLNAQDSLKKLLGLL